MNNSDIIKILIQSSNTKNTAQITERKKKQSKKVLSGGIIMLYFLCVKLINFQP